MKTQRNLSYILRLTVTLFLIATVTAALLGAVDHITAGRIAEQKAQKIQAAISTVLPGQEGQAETVEQFSDDTGTVAAVYRLGGGYAVEVKPQGFGGEIDLMVGVLDGKVTAVRIISHSETSGLGANAAASTSVGETFRDQFSGKSGALAVTKDGGEIEALTGATVTSRAVTSGVNAALACAGALE